MEPYSELTPSPTGYLATTIYTFNGSSDGLYPYAGVVADRSGSLYGTTTQGGYREGECAQTNGCGVVYKLTRSGRRFSESIIWAFHGGNDGAFPYAGLLMDQTGALFGTTYEGGLRQCSTRPSDYGGCGTVFKLTPSGSGYTKTRLYAFKGCTDGAAPFSANLIADLEGALYGTTVAGGSAREGTAFKLTPVKNGYRESVLASFDQSGGYLPYGALLLGPNNSLYGTTVAGGDPCTCGTLYEIAQ
jgi:uncharacterized repeat protein (TIGR03803 family)